MLFAIVAAAAVGDDPVSSSRVCVLFLPCSMGEILRGLKGGRKIHNRGFIPAGLDGRKYCQD